MKAIIIDDEFHCREVLRMLLAMHCPQVEVVAECTNGAEGKVAIEAHKPQLVFLDIEMPVMNAFEMLEAFEEIPFGIIFTTAYDTYAIKAIRYSALDYLLKPVDGTELEAAVEKAAKAQAQVQKQQILQLQYQLTRPESGFQLIIHTSDGTYFIPPKDIIYCEGQSNYTHFYLTRSRKLIASRTLLEYENLLTAQGFCRIHKSYLVNLNCIENFNASKTLVRLSTGEALEVSRRKKDELLNLLFSKANT